MCITGDSRLLGLEEIQQTLATLKNTVLVPESPAPDRAAAAAKKKAKRKRRRTNRRKAQREDVDRAHKQAKLTAAKPLGVGNKGFALLVKSGLLRQVADQLHGGHAGLCVCIRECACVCVCACQCVSGVCKGDTSRSWDWQNPVMLPVHHHILSREGWRVGDGLGKCGSGKKIPVGCQQTPKRDHKGLGAACSNEIVGKRWRASSEAVTVLTKKR